MEYLKKYSKRSFWVITFFVVFWAGLVSTVTYYGVKWVQHNHYFKDITNGSSMENLSRLMEVLQGLSSQLYTVVMPVIFVVFFFLGWILWMILKNYAAASFNDQEGAFNGNTNKRGSKKDFIDHKIEQDRKRRLFLHSLSVLQRDGRLLDFMNEDLSQYDDDQVGAAVRSIQEDCQKTIKKYINLQPVMNENEDDVVNIDVGFDMDAIKLVGNVTGDPPFEGVVKHRGWKAGRKEIPQLADIHDSTIIVPAEIEIQ